MVKLLDSFRAGDEFVATIFADEKTDVPGTKEELEALLLDVGAPLSCGTLIITSAFDVAFVRSDGLIQWKGDTPPTPPAEPVTVTVTMEEGLKCRFAYIDAEDENTLKSVTYTESGDYELIVPQYSTIYIVPGDGASSGGYIVTTAELETVIINNDNGTSYKVAYIEDNTEITISNTL